MQSRHAGTADGSEKSMIRTVLSSLAVANRNVSPSLPVDDAGRRGQKAIRETASTCERLQRCNEPESVRICVCGRVVGD